MNAGWTRMAAPLSLRQSYFRYPDYSVVGLSDCHDSPSIEWLHIDI